MPTLNWLGKDKVVNHHADVPYHVLDKKYTFTSSNYVESDSKSPNNRIIQGDNLIALKSLLPEFEGRIDCIYIDPPYNTGNEGWVYNDNVNDPRFLKWLGEVVGKKGEDLSRHDKWLCMMFPRLQLLKKLMHKNSRLVISIGHHEVFNLITILNEIFPTYQIVCATVQTSGGKPSGSFNFVQEYMIFVLPEDFVANPMSFTGGKSRTPFEGLTLATFNKTQRPNQTYPIFVDPKTGLLIGVGESLAERVNAEKYLGNLEDFEFDFDEAPEGTIAIWPITSKGKECVWRLKPQRLLDDWAKGYIRVSQNVNKASLNKYSIQYLPEGVIKKLEESKLKIQGVEENGVTLSFGENKTEGTSIPTLWLEKEFYSVNGTKLVDEIFAARKFNYPKPLALITEVLRALTFEDDIILDSFAGSGTTGHAVLELNKQDLGSRKFILCEMMDYVEEITAERIRRAMNGYSINSNFIEGYEDSFEFYTLGHSMFTEEGMLNEKVGIEKIRSYISHSEKIPNEYRLEIDNPICPSAIGHNYQTLWLLYYQENTMTSLDLDFLSQIKLKHLVNRPTQFVIYADKCALDEKFMLDKGIVFKRIPRDIFKF